MSKQTVLRTAGGILGCLALVLCAGVTAFAGVSYYWAASAVESVNRIVYVDNRLNIQVVDSRGQHRVALTTDALDSDPEFRVYLYPTWSRDSRRIAFVGLSGDRYSREGAINVAPVAGGRTTTLYTSETRMPFYLYWAPDSQRIGFLTESEEAMALLVQPVSGQSSPRTVSSGASLYWSWSPDSTTMLLHSGGSHRDSSDAHLALVSAQDSRGTNQLSNQPGSFQTPEYSPDGASILYAEIGRGAQDELFVADAHGGKPRSLMTYTGTIAFAWSPKGNRIATLVSSGETDMSMSGPIVMFDADGSHRRQIGPDDALAFYWSPDGTQIAFLTLAREGIPSECIGCLRSARQSGRTALGLTSRPHRQDETLQLSWHVAGVRDGKVRTVATFVPTESFVSLLPFFDQYARSLTFWSPDSKQFVFTQSENDTEGSVWVADLAGGTSARQIGEGTLAVWSWR